MGVCVGVKVGVEVHGGDRFGGGVRRVGVKGGGWGRLKWKEWEEEC